MIIFARQHIATPNQRSPYFRQTGSAERMVLGAQLAVPPTPAPPVKYKTRTDDDAKHIDEFVVMECEFHFRLFALTENRSYAAIYHMDQALDPPHNEEPWGQLVISAHPFIKPRPDPNPQNEGVFMVDLPRSSSLIPREKTIKVLYPVKLLRPMTIGELTAFLLDRNMHEYVLTSEYLGCRYFMIALLSELELAGYVPEKSGERLQILAEKRLESETRVGMFPNFKRP